MEGLWSENKYAELFLIAQQPQEMVLFQDVIRWTRFIKIFQRLNSLKKQKNYYEQ